MKLRVASGYLTRKDVVNGEQKYSREIDAELIRKSWNALLFKIEDREVWIPLSQMSWLGNYDRNPIYITEWIAKQKNI